MSNVNSDNNHLEIGYLTDGTPVIVNITTGNQGKKVELFSEIDPNYSRSADSMLEGLCTEKAKPFFWGDSQGNKDIRKIALQLMLAPEEEWPAYYMWTLKSMSNFRSVYSNRFDIFKKFVMEPTIMLSEEEYIRLLEHFGVTEEARQEYEASIPVDFAAIAEAIHYRKHGKLLPENANYAVGYDWQNIPTLAARDDNGNYRLLNNLPSRNYNIWSPWALVPDRVLTTTEKLLPRVLWFPTHLYNRYTSTGGILTEGDLHLIPTPFAFYNMYFKTAPLEMNEELCKKILLKCAFSEEEIQEAIEHIKRSPRFIVNAFYQRDVKKRKQEIQKHLTLK